MATKKRDVRGLPVRRLEPARPPGQVAATAVQLLEALRALNAHAEGEHQERMTDHILGSSDVLVNQWQREFPEQAGIDAFTLTIRVRRLAMLVDEGLVARGQRAGVKLNEMLLMLALRRVGPPYALRPTDILKMHSVTSGTVTYRIDQLINQGFAERTSDTSDKRSYLIRLTSKGFGVVDRAIEESAQTAQEYLGPLMRLPFAHEMFVEMLRFYERRIESSADQVEKLVEKASLAPAPPVKRRRAA